MSSIRLTEILPTPVQQEGKDEWYNVVTRDPWFKGHETTINQSEAQKMVAIKEPPPYGRRKGFVPRTPEDFGDGGAFPEIHIAQFPLGMGMERSVGTNKDKTLALQFDEEGKLRFDEVARIGHGKDKVVHSRLSDMKAKIIDEEDDSFQKPTDDEILETTEATRMALEKITTAKIAAALPVQHAKKTAPAQYIRYTPSQQSGTNAGGAQQRIIRLVEEQKDPMEPPRFQINQKIPRAPPSPPAPVMHSPTRKVSAKEQADWKIPPCISNWKNPKGYTVALDKRLAADGRGLQQVHINENFAKMAEALSIAERKAREAVETRAQMERRIAQNKKTEQEKRMRELAQNARVARAQALKKTEDESTTAVEEAKERELIRRDRIEDHRRDRNIARSRPDKLEKPFFIKPLGGVGGEFCPFDPWAEREDSETVSSSGSSVLSACNGGIFCNKSPFASSAIGELNLGQLLKRAFAEPSRLLTDPQMLAVIQETMLQKYAANGTTAAALAAALLNKAGTCDGGTAPTAKAPTPSPKKGGGERDGKFQNGGAAGDGVVALNIVPNDNVFSQVPGRLSLLSNVVKYKVTVGEIKRRLIGPESFNFSLLGAMLRRAKMPEKSAMLMGELNQVGLSIPRGRRRLSQVTLLSALTETESTQFVRDFKKLAESDFPSEKLAAELLRQRTKRRTTADGAQGTARERVEKLTAALKLAEEFLTLLEQDRSPIMDTVPEPILRQELQEPFSNFSMLTHGFGNPAVQVGISCFVQCLRHQIRLLEEQQQRPNGTARTK
uniref:SKIP_SNW domain-containing protein n=1 Tax=Globodera pallida TaxID=36090 RepID=A0A183BL32_GLOPA